MYMENCLREIEFLLAEDLMLGDPTSEVIGDKDVSAEIICNERCVLAGVEIITEFLRRRGIECEFLAKDGEWISEGRIAILSGKGKEILKVERTVLNVLGRMCGVATLTRKFVDKIKEKSSKTIFAATRKTLLRFLDKEAVRIGGGAIHRLVLGDMFMFKDNHRKILDVEKAVRNIKNWDFAHKIEVEVSTVDDALEISKIADIVMLDNFSVSDVKKFMDIVGDRRNFLVEVSGGITLENVGDYASTGVDIISSGYVTKNAKIVDFSLEIIPESPRLSSR